jgi:hypothetical protein
MVRKKATTEELLTPSEPNRTAKRVELIRKEDYKRDKRKRGQESQQQMSNVVESATKLAREVLDVMCQKQKAVARVMRCCGGTLRRA